MIEDRSQGALETARAFASARGLREKFESRLAYLNTYAEHGERGRTRCVLYRDHAPYSFYFEMFLKGEPRRWFNGGFIYYGPGDVGASAPQFSVRLDGSDEDWTINT